jgi:hypothetical protein
MKTQLHSLVALASKARVLTRLLPRPTSLWAALALLAVHAFGPQPAQAAVTEAWVQRYNGSANGNDGTLAVALDGTGNVVVTGSSYNGTNLDYYTAKYAAANGALLWEKRYNGPANGNDSVGTHSLALGPNGMVAITGSSDGIFNSLTNSDCATVVYWEKLPPVSIAPDGTGGYFIRGSGIAGFSYQVQRAANVTGPWASNATMTATSPGLIEFHDTNAPSGQAFYRTVQP